MSIYYLMSTSEHLKPGECIVIEKDKVYQAVKDDRESRFDCCSPRPDELEAFIKKVEQNWSMRLDYSLEKDHYVMSKPEEVPKYARCR